MRERALLLVVGASLLAAQNAPVPNVPAESVLLGRIRAHMGEVLRSVPNYTCIETMERTRRVGPAHRFQMEDTLRLEVALVEGKEMFAWPGSKKFENDDLRNLISTGTYGNGAFALFARAVFMGNAPTFVYRGEEPINGRNLVRYDFRVTQITSGYQIRVQDHEATVAYHGSFWADPQTLDAARLEVVADDIPPILDLAYSSDRIDFARARIGQEDFLLPSESELEMRQPSGLESRNFVRFSACRQYTGESVLRFDDVTADGDNPKPPDEEIVLPMGLELRVSLLDDIDPATVAGGDEVHASLINDLKEKGKILAAKGSVVVGRITRLERYPEQIVLGIAFTDLYGGGKHAALSLQFERTLMPVLWTPPRTPLLVEPAPHEGLIQIRPGRVVLKRGMLMYWRT